MSRRRWALQAAVLSLLVGVVSAGREEEVWDDWEERLARSIPAPEEVQVVQSPDGVAATLNVEASRAAVEVMARGGNAMDAAAAAWLVLTVVSPNQTGLGAGGYILYHEASTGQTYFLDAAHRAAMAAHPGVFLDENGEPLSNSEIRARGMSVGVPGLVRGFDVALKRWGTRYFDELARPAIELAEGGWPVDRELSLRIHQTRETLDESARDVYMRRGRPLRPGERLVQRDKARALRLIAEGGSHPFYQGEIAEAVARHVQELGGLLTVEDFQRYNVTVDVPLWIRYGDYQVATNPNAQGGNTLATLLRLLEPFEIGRYEPRSLERYHLILEATRLASAESGLYFTDPEFVDVPWQGMASEEFLEARRALIRLDERMEEVESGDPWAYQPGGPYRTRGHHPDYDEGTAGDGATAPEPEGTDHFTVADAEGNVVAVTSTLGGGWAAGHMVPEFGFMLNVRGAAFARSPGSVDEVRPGKRASSNMTPAMVHRNGRAIMTVGSPSPGPMQHVQVMLNVLEHGMDPARAIAEPRVAPDDVWEDGVPHEVLEGLRALGHPMEEEWSDQGAVPLILWTEDGWLGASDPRREGVALGVKLQERSPP